MYACCCCGESGAKPYVRFRRVGQQWVYDGLVAYCDTHAEADRQKKAVYRLVGGTIGELLYQFFRD